MKALFLTEGNEKIGFGHIVRCMALCQGFERAGISSEFVVKGSSYITSLLEGKKYSLSNWVEDKGKILEVAKNFDISVVDSYLADRDIYCKLSELFKERIIMIDDYKRLDYPKGFVVNPSIAGDSLDYPNNEGVRYLLGKDYIILRKEFWEVPEKKVGKEIEKVLITFGGSNTSIILNSIVRELRKIFNFKFIIVDPIKNRLKAKDLFNLMLDCDICISGGGQTLYELIRIGVPTIGICIAENQKVNLEFCEKRGLIDYVGWFNDKEVPSRIAHLIKGKLSYAERVRRFRAGKENVDGKGINRIVRSLLKEIE